MAKILIVDDEAGIRELLSEILYDEGHSIELAENAAQARSLRQASRPDLVLLDIWMPDTDGVTLLKEWGSQGLLTMPVIMMSGHATIDTAVEATRIGAYDFLEKPITMQKLLSTISSALDSHKNLSGSKVAAVAQPTQAELPKVTSIAVDTDYSAGTTTTGVSTNGTGFEQTLDVFKRGILDIDLKQNLRDARDQFERLYFEFHLDKENGSMTRVAENTGLERTHLYRKLKQLGIELNRRRKS